MVDPARVSRLLEALSECRERLDALRALPPDEYTGDRALAGRYLVQASAQICIDLANHVIASSGWRAPTDFRDTFTVLEEHEVVAPELAEQMRALAGLRNRLVHVYEDIDDRIIHASLSEGLIDLAEYARAIADLTRRE